MAISPFLLEILVCPETKAPVKLADSEFVQKLNTLIDQGKLVNREGEVIKEKIDAALVREDGKVAYPVRMDIPIMLVSEGIPL